VVGGSTWYCGSKGLMGSSVAERRFGAPSPMDGDGSWTADAEAEVLELLVALRAAWIKLAVGRKKGCQKRRKIDLPLAASLPTLTSLFLRPPSRFKLSTLRPAVLPDFFLPPLLPFLVISSPSSHFCRSQK